MRREFLLPFLALAAIGFLLSVIVHGYALAGLTSPLGGFAWGLHVGLFLVWLPAIVISKYSDHKTGLKRGGKGPFRGCPTWMKYLAYILNLYAFINFFLSTNLSLFAIHPAKSQMGIMQTARAFSGGWAAFYYIGFAMLFSAYRLEPWTPCGECANGHRVPIGNPVCSACGMLMDQPPPLPRI
jgi:hypothetical protein